MNEFLDTIIHEPIVLGEPAHFVGPDHFRYLAVFRRDGGVKTTLIELAVRATNEGLGAALNPRGDGGVDWVFSYGDLLSLRMFGYISTVRPDIQTSEVLQRSEQVLIGAPSAEVIPLYARPHIAAYLRAAGVASPGVVMMHRPGADSPQQLFFNAPPSALNRLTWFFPRHYAIMGTDHPLDYFPLDE